MASDHRPWWRVDADTDESEKLSRLPNDSARWAWFRTGCRAKTQRRMGIFAGRLHLKTMLGGHGRYIPDLIRVGVLHDWPSDCDRCAKDYLDAVAGDVVVHDYRRKQRDPTNADRQARWRSSQPSDGESNALVNGESNALVNGESNGKVTFSSRALSPSPSMSPSDSVGETAVPSGLRDDATWQMAQLVEDLTGRPNAFGAGSRVLETLRSDVAQLGVERVESALRGYRAASHSPMDAAVLVFGAHKTLIPMPGRPAKTKGYQPTTEDRDALAD